MKATISRRQRLRPRSRMDIMASILKETTRPSRKTKIMYRSNLSFRQLKVYLKLLVEEGFLEAIAREEGKTVVEVFQITDEGRSFLSAYDDLRKKFPRSRRC